MFETLAQFVLSDHLGGYGFDPPTGPIGYNRLLSLTRRPYPTSDGFLAIVVYTDQHWRRFFELIVLGATDYLIIGLAVVVWALILRQAWRHDWFERFLGLGRASST